MFKIEMVLKPGDTPVLLGDTRKDREFINPIEALQHLVAFSVSLTGFVFHTAECYRFEGTERKERQWQLTID